MIPGQWELYAIRGLNPSFNEVCRHFEKYTYRHMKQMDFVTAPGKRFWHEKRTLVYEFLRQYRRDLGLMD